jgi:hypothetical protein
LKIFYNKKQWRPPIKKKKREKKLPRPEEQEGMPQRQHCPLEKRRRDRTIGTQSAMKSIRNTLHEFTSHIPQKVNAEKMP